MKKRLTLREENALQFGVDLITKHGIGYIVRHSCRMLSYLLQSRGTEISWLTIRNYLEALVSMGYAKKKSRGSHTSGVEYTLNRYKFNKLINAVNEKQTIIS